MVVDGKAATWGQCEAWAGREDEKRAPVNVWDLALPCWDPGAAKATPAVPDQLPLTLRCHFGDTEAPGEISLGQDCRS